MTEKEKDTKERILETAERMFADKGFAATSLRAITAEADVNLAAVHYHFGSREELIRAVFARRVDPLNQERLQLLEECEARAGDGSPELEEILRALIWPALRVARNPETGGSRILHLMGKLHAESDEKIDDLLMERFSVLGRRFMKALHRVLPDLPWSDLSWRFLFTIGAMAFTMIDRRKLRSISRGQCTSSDVEAALEQMITFTAAGMRAAVPAPAGGKKR